MAQPRGGQILIVTDGTGYHQIKGGQVEELHVGDVAFRIAHSTARVIVTVIAR